MPMFPIGLGGGELTDRPTPKYTGDQAWREPQSRGAPSGIDWEKDEKYFSPQPCGKRRFGGFKEPDNELPETPTHMINVKGNPPRTYFHEGVAIPGDRFTPVPITPEVLLAIKNGDLERGPDPTPGGQAEPHRAGRRGAAAPHRAREEETRRHRHEQPPPTPPAE